MTAPKPGDRVRVTFEAVVEKVYDDLVRVCTQATSCGAFGGSVPIESVEVLASPVYVNSDTTEYHFADVVKDAGGNTLFRTESEWRWCAFDGEGPRAPMQPLTLLVRDGKPVPQ